MSFARPSLLVLALLLPLAIAVLVAAWANRRRSVARVLAERALLGRLGGGDLESFPVRRLALLGLAAALLGLASAGPRWGMQAVEGRSHARSVVLAADVSKSMLAEDVQPNRLERERLFIRRLLRGLGGDRVGLVAFAGRAYVLAPLTVDMGALNVYVDALDPGIVSQGGSSIAAAISQAADLARGPAELSGDRSVILLSDGEALEDPQVVLAAADRAARAGVRVLAVGVGTSAGARVPEMDADRFVGFKVDEEGDTVISRLNARLLQDVAAATGGAYYPLSDARSVDRVLAALGGMSRVETGSGTRVEPRDRFALFALLALLLLALDAAHEMRARSEAARRGRSTRVSPAVRLALLAALTIPLAAAGIGDQERGNRLFRQGRYADAVEAYQSALRAGARSPELRYNLGTAFLRLGRYAEAEESFRAALDAVDPALRQRTYYNLGSRFLEAARSGDDPEAGSLLGAAVDAYQRALRLRPEDPEAKWNLEMALREADRRSRTGPQGQDPGRSEESEPDPSRGGSGGSGSEASADPRDTPGPAGHAPLSREQAERILDAVEHGERDLTREKLRKGQRRTPVGRDW